MKHFLFRTGLFLILLHFAGTEIYAQAFRQFSDGEGAPETTVQGIVQDREGYMWFATTQGLFRYDTQTFKAYLPDSDKPGSIGSHYIQDVFCDSKGILWVATRGGLSLYDRQTDSFSNFRYNPKNEKSLASDIVYSVIEDSQGDIWSGTSKGLCRIRTTNGQTEIKRYGLNEFEGQSQVVRCMAEGRNGILWLGTENGLVRMQKNGSKTRLYQIKAENNSGAATEFLAIFRDKKNRIWLGSNREGLIVFDETTENFQRIESLKRQDGGLPNIARIISDKTGQLWLATLSGLIHFDPESKQGRWFTNKADNPYSLPDNLLYSVYQDRQGGIWTGGYFKGVSYMYPGSSDFQIPNLPQEFIPRSMGQTKHGQLWAVDEDRKKVMLFKKGFNHIRFYDLQLPSPVSYSIFYLDPNLTLWCGGNSILTSYNLNTGQRKDFPLRKSREGARIQEKISVIYEDGNGRFWLGGRFGLLLFDQTSGTFSSTGLRQSLDFSVTSNHSVFAMLEDSKENLWVGGKAEVFLLRKSSTRFEQVPVKQQETSTLKYLQGIREDDTGKIWFAAYGFGLMSYLPVSGIITQNRGIGNSLTDYIIDIQSDSKNHLWLNGEAKLIRYDLESGSKQYYNAQDGLPPGGTITTSVRDNDGVLYYGTNKGMFWFDPKNISGNNHPAPIEITAIKLFNRPVKIGDSTQILVGAISNGSQIEFKHNQNVFTLEFALLNFHRSDKNQFAYRLEGFEESWNYVSSPTATYTNLPAGRYTFWIKAANGDGYWNKESFKLSIVVLPPWWKTWYAYAAYILIIAGIVYEVTRFLWLRKSNKKENELYQSKLDFFTNISHEIRTHLSLIGAPIEKAFQSTSMDDSTKSFLAHAKSNSNRLLNLVNELLDFRKMQSGSSRLAVSERDVLPLLKNVLSAFELMAVEKGIKTTLVSEQESVMLWFDLSQLQKVFYNLLSNAYKFTPEAGNVSVVVKEDVDDVIIQVIDNGRGIAPEHIGKLFTNFFQVYEGNKSNTGYGIGLALSKGIVEQHHGELSVTSQLISKNHSGRTCFTVKLPKGKEHFTVSQLAPVHSTFNSPVHTEILAIPHQKQQGAGKYTLLFIEDNDELRAFQRECFRDSYHILEAGNGQQGFEIAKEHIPDLIVCDIVMPGISGLEVCNNLKADILTSHIPIILLSAMSTSPHQVMHGLKAGANDYLVKPFDLGMLELKISNLIQLQETLRQRFGHSSFLEPDAVEAKDLDGEFIIKLKNLLIENISDPGFGVNQMALEVGISVSVLYRKLRSVTGMTANEFMKTIRMKRAWQLLESGTYNVGEVTTIVGFENSQYFGREFKKMFGKTPNEVRKNSGGDINPREA